VEGAPRWAGCCDRNFKRDDRYVGNTQRLTATFGEVRLNDTFEIKEKEIKERPRRQRDHDYDDE
jgi:hypothetical protein